MRSCFHGIHIQGLSDAYGTRPFWQAHAASASRIWTTTALSSVGVEIGFESGMFMACHVLHVASRASTSV